MKTGITPDSKRFPYNTGTALLAPLKSTVVAALISLVPILVSILMSGKLNAPVNGEMTALTTDAPKSITGSTMALIGLLISFGINFLNPVDNDTEHLDAYNSIDIALDTFPYNGTTTTLEALLMGTPVLTLRGTSHRSRVSYSILANLGLNEFAPETVEDFVSQGMLLSKNPQYLGALSASLRFLLSKSPLNQHQVFIENYENLLKQTLIPILELAQSHQ